MKRLPVPDLSTAGLFELPNAVVKWKLMHTAVELKIFDQLSAPQTAASVAAQLGTDAENTEIILNSLVAIGCLEKQDGTYINTPSAEVCWTTGKDTSLGESFIFFSSWLEPVLGDGMLNMVKNGAPPKPEITDPGIWKQAAYAGLNYTRCARAQAVAKLVSELPEFGRFGKILDMGAGPGIIGIAIALLHPTLECVLYDQPAVAEVAAEVISEYELGGRARVLEGNYVEDDIGSGYDLVLASFTLNFYREKLPEIFQKVYASLNPGGIFMVCSDGVNREKTAPEATVLSWLATSLQGMSMEFEAGMVAEVMRQNGFVSTARQFLGNIPLEAHGPIEVTIGRK